MSSEILEALKKGLSNSFNFEIDSENDVINIKKSKVKSCSLDNWVYEQYQKKYKELIANKKFEQCLELYNSGHLNQTPRTIGYKPESKEEIRSSIALRLNYSNKRLDLNWIDVSEITNMRFLFCRLPEFNCDISEWDVSNVTDMCCMFQGCHKFNHPIGKWDVSNVANMSAMFSQCVQFNQDLSSWDVSNVTDMCNMFYGCSNFNSDLSKWDVSNVTDMCNMFYGCSNFNSDLSKWDVSNVENDEGMFSQCPIEEKYKPKK